MSEEDDSEKSHAASQKRLDDARDRGEVPYSADLTTAAAYGGFVLVAAGFGSGAVIALATQLELLLEQSDRLSTDVFTGGGALLAGSILQGVGASMLPWLSIPAALALLSVLAQQGIVFAGVKLEPKLSRISPLATMKQKFGLTGLVEFGKSLAKLVIYSVVLGFYLHYRLPELLGTVYLSPGLAIAELFRLTIGLLLFVLLVSVVLGLFDLVWQRINHQRKNMMSRQELIEEMKESDGDPAMKQQRRQRGISLAMNQMLAEVPKADVVIVNPTHYAVALRWDRESRRAPVCVAKGTDEIAARIREIAAEHAIPLQSDPPTARALYAGVEIGAEISRDHYRAVAAAIRFAERIRQKARKS